MVVPPDQLLAPFRVRVAEPDLVIARAPPVSPMAPPTTMLFAALKVMLALLRTMAELMVRTVAVLLLTLLRMPVLLSNWRVPPFSVVVVPPVDALTLLVRLLMRIVPS